MSISQQNTSISNTYKLMDSCFMNYEPAAIFTKVSPVDFDPFVFPKLLWELCMFDCTLRIESNHNSCIVSFTNNVHDSNANVGTVKLVHGTLYDATKHIVFSHVKEIDVAKVESQLHQTFRKCFPSKDITIRDSRGIFLQLQACEKTYGLQNNAIVSNLFCILDGNGIVQESFNNVEGNFFYRCEGPFTKDTVVDAFKKLFSGQQKRSAFSTPVRYHQETALSPFASSLTPLTKAIEGDPSSSGVSSSSVSGSSSSSSSGSLTGSLSSSSSSSASSSSGVSSSSSSSSSAPPGSSQGTTKALPIVDFTGFFKNFMSLPEDDEDDDEEERIASAYTTSTTSPQVVSSPIVSDGPPGSQARRQRLASLGQLEDSDEEEKRMVKKPRNTPVNPVLQSATSLNNNAILWDENEWKNHIRSDRFGSVPKIGPRDPQSRIQMYMDKRSLALNCLNISEKTFDTWVKELNPTFWNKYIHYLKSVESLL